MRQAICILALFLFAGSAQVSNEMLALHNAARARAGTPPLAWSSQLAARSQTWANTLLARGEFRHTPSPVYGENLFEIVGAAASPAEVVNMWMSESPNYNYSSNTCSGTCGHYTQIIWNTTRSVGCASARGHDREIWVCTYDPPGNWIGRRPY